MEKFIIQGGKPLIGEIEVSGCKNAATPILTATLLTDKPCIIDNLPLVEDVLKMIEILKSMGSQVQWLGERKVKIQNKDIDPGKLNQKLVCQMRSSVLLLGPILARFSRIKIAQPGGCIIGVRSIDVHLDAFRKMGADIEEGANFFNLKVKNQLLGNEIVLKEFSVTATENILMAAALAEGKTTIKIAAAEPHVQDLCHFLQKMGAKIQGAGTHTLKIIGQKKLKGAEHFLIYDPVEAGTYMIMAAASRGKVRIKNTPISYLDLVLEKFQEFKIPFVLNGKNSIQVEPWQELKIDKVQCLPYPGIPTDLQSAFGVLATQSPGSTLIHDPLYEGRLKYLEELNKMGAEIIICDPHRAIVNGPTKLYGAELGTIDLRGGAALVIAGLVANGKTVIKNIAQIDRGYEKIEEKLKKLGADIKRVNG